MTTAVRSDLVQQYPQLQAPVELKDSMTDLTAETEPFVKLAGQMAHELNNIFTVVVGNISLLDSGLVDPAERAVIIQEITEAANSGIALSSNLQAFSGQQVLKVARVDLNAIVSQTLNAVFLSSGTLLQSRLAAEKLMILGDEKKLESVIEELLFNAEAAVSPTGGTIVVETVLGKGAAGPHAWLCIRDNGCGMEQEVARRAAIPLFTTAHNQINKGWGLSSCTGIIRQLRGRITLSSHPHRGTSVEIQLPLA